MGTVAALSAGGVAAILISEPASAPVSQPTTDPVVTAPVDTSAWVQQAQIAQASVNSQLQEVAKAESALTSLPKQQQDALTEDARELAARKEQLTRQGATLNAALSAQQQIPSVQANLQAAQQQLAAVEGALNRGEQTTTAPSVLAAQRDSLQRSVDSMRQSAESWRATINEATRMPLPTDSDVTDTKRLTDRALARAKPDNRPGKDASRQRGLVQALPEHDRSSRRARDQVTTTAPPRTKQVKTPTGGKSGASTAYTTKPKQQAATSKPAKEQPKKTVQTKPSTKITVPSPKTGKNKEIDVDSLLSKAQKLYADYQKTRESSSPKKTTHNSNNQSNSSSHNNSGSSSSSSSHGDSSNSSSHSDSSSHNSSSSHSDSSSHSSSSSQSSSNDHSSSDHSSDHSSSDHHS